MRRYLAATLLIASFARAEEIPESFVPVRPQGIGGAFTAIANDEDAVWTNPAGISRVRKPRSRSTVNLVRFPNIIVGANTKSQEFMKGVRSGSDDLSSVAERADELGEKPFWATAGAYPVMMLDIQKTPAVIGAYTLTTLKSVISRDNPELANTNAVSDTGGIFGMAWTDRSNRFSLGFTSRYVVRLAYEDRVPVSVLAEPKELQSRIKAGSNKSGAVGLDFGMLWTIADFWFPTIGLAVLNAPLGCQKEYLDPFSKKREEVCGTVFRGDLANPEAISVVDPTDIRFGLSITPRFSHSLAARIAVDVHHMPFVAGEKVYGLQDIDFMKQFHAGIEFFTGNPLVPSPFTVAVGISQGYYTFGAGVRLGYLALDFTTFGKDISNTASPIEDRRMLFNLSLDL